MGKKLSLLALGLALTGCVSMTPHEQRQYKEIKTSNLPCDEIKNPGAAAALNILPGIGDFYLASGAGQGHMWAVGALDLLFWPISVVWGVPQAAISADAINSKECVYYYTATIEGKKEMLARKEELEKISQMGDLAKNKSETALPETATNVSN